MAQLGTCVNGSPYIKRLDTRTSRLNIFKQDVVAFHLEVLEKAPNLKILEISHNPVQTLDLAPLKRCLLLEELSIGAVEPIDLAPLASCLNLEALSIRCHAWTEIDLSPLFGHPRLGSLSITRGQFQELDLSPLGTCPKLSHLGIETQSLSRLDLSPLTDCLSMRSLTVYSGNLQRLDLSPCHKWANLELINLLNFPLETLDLRPLSTTRLRRLHLAGPSLTHLNLTPLVGLKTLTALVFKPIPKLYLDAQYMDAPGKIASPAIRQYLGKGWCSKLSVRVKELISQGNTFHNNKEYEQAIAAYREVIALMPDSTFHVSYNLIIGDMLVEMQRYEEAAQAYHEIAKAVPEHDQAWASLGECLMLLGRDEEAAQAFDRCLDIDPNASRALYHAAMVHAKLNNPGQAGKYLERALQFEPEWEQHAQQNPLLKEYLSSITTFH